MVIRWMGVYGVFKGLDSLKWELTQKQREVAAEWTVSNRPFILGPQYNIFGDVYSNSNVIGLLVKSKSVIRRTKCDTYSSIIDNCILHWKRKSNKRLEREMMHTHAWEACCYPSYVGIVVGKGVKKDNYDAAIEASIMFKIPLLMYWANKNSNTGSWQLHTEII